MSKVVLITGASSGIGFSMATYLATRGYIVYGTSRSIKNTGQNFKPLVMDVCDSGSVGIAIEQILSESGKIDVVINNAGLGLAGPVEQLSLEDVNKVINTNVFGSLRVMQEVLPGMRKQKSGKIINISSIGSEIGLPYRGGYSASKAALDRLSEALRMELKRFGVQVCTVQPGGIATEINANRVMTPMANNSVYKDSFEKTYEIINKSVSSGMSPNDLGPFMEKLIEADRLKRNYRIGKFTEKLSVVLKRILPDVLFEKIIAGHYKL